MQYLEPRQAILRFDDITINGTLSGSLDSVKFESNDATFLQHFPKGGFDSLVINDLDCTQRQKDIIGIAQDLVKMKLKNEY